MDATEYAEACERLDIPEGLRKHAAPNAPARGKLVVARGMLPAAPKALLALQFLLLGDPNKEVAAEANKALLELPEDRLLGLIDDRTHPKILEFLAYRRTEEYLLEQICLRRQLNDKTVCYLAETGSTRITEMVAQNQERLLVTPEVFRFLAKNPNTAQNVIDRTTSFMRMHGLSSEASEAEIAASARAAQARATGAASPPVAKEPDVVPAAAAAPAQGASEEVTEFVPATEGLPPMVELGEDGLPADFVSGEPYIPAAPEFLPTPPEGLLNPLEALLLDWGMDVLPEYVAPPLGWQDDTAGRPLMTRAAVDVDSVDALDLTGFTSVADTDFAFGMEEEGDDFGSMFTEDKESTDEEEKIGLKQAVSRLTTGQKIKLSYKGNKEVREILIRDRNKIVACAVVKSGRLTENEVKSVAGNRGVAEDVLRLLAMNREYMRKYPVKVAMAGNPKTPIPVAMSLIKQLGIKDLKLLASNRNVSSAVFGSALKLYKMKRDNQS
jgi:hypothetical protein